MADFRTLLVQILKPDKPIHMKKIILLCLFTALTTVLPAQTVFINEIHYDNASADTGEGIEIVIPESFDYTGWKIYCYNGNGGTVYVDDFISNLISFSNTSDGYEFLWLPITGLQNGAPDGIALVDNSATLIQFLSYEGSFTANEGPAQGLTSTDIGVMEAGDTDPNYSLQLQGTGTEYTDFTWAVPVTNTKGNKNTGQTFTTTDTDPPEWAAGYPYTIPHYDIGTDLYAKLQEAGTVYYLLLLDGSETPTSEEVKAGVDFGSTTVVNSGSFELAAEASVKYVVDGADPDTSYKLYVVAEDENGNLQTSPEVFHFTTGSARTITISKPLANETYFVGDQVTFEWTATSNISLVEIIGYHYRNQEEFAIAATDQGYPLSLDASLGVFEYTIPLDAATDSVAIIIRNASDYEVFDSISPVYLDDIIPPGIVDVYPANQAVDQGTNVQITLEYNEEIFPGSGKFYIRNEDGSLFEEMDISGEGDAQPLDIVMDGYQININPTSDYLVGNTYYLEADQGVLLDYFGIPTDAISGNSTLSFTIVKGSDATLSDLMVAGTTIDGFDPGTYTYTHIVNAGETVVPAVTATSSDPNADISVDPAVNLDGTLAERTATVTVIADDESATLNYTVTFELATGIDSKLADELRIYPVPASTSLMLENISTIGYIEVLDITGSRVYEKITGGESNHRIDVSSLPRGIYFLKLSDTRGTTTRKFIKR